MCNIIFIYLLVFVLLYYICYFFFNMTPKGCLILSLILSSLVLIYGNPISCCNTINKMFTWLMLFITLVVIIYYLIDQLLKEKRIIC